jgi:hypothetical protein
VHVGLEPEAAHASPHARKLLPPVAPALSVTTLPRLRLAVQVLAKVAPEIAQSIPLPATVPVPVLFGPGRMRSASSGGVGGSGADVYGWYSLPHAVRRTMDVASARRPRVLLTGRLTAPSWGVFGPSS